MKKIIAVLSAVLLFSLSTFAEETVTSKPKQEQNIERSETYISVQNLIDEGLESNFSKISALSENLTDDEKTELYGKNSIPYWTIPINAAGFGIGSYIQGDKKFAVPISIFDGISFLSTGIGLSGLIILGLGDLYIHCLSDDPVPSLFSTNPEITTVLTSMTLAGLACHAVITIISVIRAAVYPKGQNEMLSNALNPKKNDPEEFTLLPLLAPDKNLGIAPGFVCSINF